MAFIPKWAEAPISSSGTEAPSRKLNADRACSSTYPSVIAALDKPSGRRAIDTVQRAIAQGDIPFIALPGIDRPPVAGGAPGPRELKNTAADTGGGHECRPAGIDRDAGGARRAKD